MTIVIYNNTSGAIYALVKPKNLDYRKVMIYAHGDESFGLVGAGLQKNPSDVFECIIIKNLFEEEKIKLQGREMDKRVFIQEKKKDGRKIYKLEITDNDVK